MNLDEEPSNTIECPRCGAEVYYEINSCPKCGWNFYDPSKNEAEPDVLPSASGVAWKAVFFGLAALAFAFYWLNVVLQRIFPGGELPAYGGWLLVGVDFLAGAAGGYVAGVLAEKNWRTHGGIIAGVAVFLVVLFDGMWYASPLRLEVLVGLAAAVAGALLASRWIVSRLESKSLGILFTPKSETALYKDLLARVNYDQAAAERLIDYEKRWAPRATRRDWIQTAIDHWDKDNR